MKNGCVIENPPTSNKTYTFKQVQNLNIEVLRTQLVPEMLMRQQIELKKIKL